MRTTSTAGASHRGPARPRRRFPVLTATLALAVAALGWAGLAVAPRLAALGDTAPEAVAVPPATALDPGTAAAVERARQAAAEAGVTLVVASGFRSAAEQQALLDAEVAARGSLEEAQRWVFPPERSMHVRGLAVDIGSGPAADWLLAEGARFGLCQTLGWEWWHFEWRAEWEAAGSCPPPAADPAGAPPAP